MGHFSIPSTPFLGQIVRFLFFLCYHALCIFLLNLLELLLFRISVFFEIDVVLGPLVLVSTCPTPVFLLLVLVPSILVLPGLSELLPSRVVKLDVFLIKLSLLICISLAL